MILFRAVRSSDIDDIYHLATKAGVGLTTLPADKKILGNRIEQAVASFQKKVSTPQDESYFFVLEDLTTKKVIGTSAIEAYVGYHLPFYSYHISHASSICHSLKIRNDYEFLSLVNDYQGKTEICSLFLDDAYRNHNNGTLLSRSRFVFMSEFPQRFADIVFADMRGVSDEEGRSPFWESLGKHFFLMDFKKADYLTMITNKQFIADLMPRKPIYTLLLSKEAQAVIGKPHPSTVPAFKILSHEGFIHRNYVDIFDAGPTIEARLNDIVTVKNSKELIVTHYHEASSNAPFIIANTSLDFRALMGSVDEVDDHHGGISQGACEILQVKIGDKIRIAAGTHHAKL